MSQPFVVDEALTNSELLRAGARRPWPTPRTGPKFESIVGRSARLARTLVLVERIAESDGPVLIKGERGSGKALFARALHDNSRRADQPFVRVRCGAVPDDQLEAELFGRSPGSLAFPTHLPTSRNPHPDLGRFAAADGGTILLDEIGELGPRLQVALLRALEEKHFDAIGPSTRPSLGVRVIAATRHDLEERVALGLFREDLYERLGVLTIDVPPLRERIEDLPLLVHHFLDRARKERDTRVSGFSDAALQRLVDHPWPGNVRELENLIERLAVLVGEGEIDLADLPDSLRAEPRCDSHAPRLPATGLDFNEVVIRFENDLIVQALERTGWNKNRAAKLLRLNRTTLIEKIKKRALTPRKSQP